MKKLLATSGYPRSGNVYLNKALQLFYFPEQPVYFQRHTVKSIDNSKSIIIPFRNPIDCISSFNYLNMQYGVVNDISVDIKFYIRFHSAVLNNLNKVILMDFDFFTKDIDYIKNKVFKNFGIKTDNYVIDAQVKEAMLANDKHINLPRNNKEELNTVKEQLVNQPLFDECINLYKQIKESK